MSSSKLKDQVTVYLKSLEDNNDKLSTEKDDDNDDNTSEEEASEEEETDDDDDEEDASDDSSSTDKEEDKEYDDSSTEEDEYDIAEEDEDDSSTDKKDEEDEEEDEEDEEDDEEDEGNEEEEEDKDEVDEDEVDESYPDEDEVTLHHIFTDEPYYHIPPFSSDIQIEGFDTLRVSICAYIINNHSYNDPYISFLLQQQRHAENTGLLELVSFLYEPLNEINHHDFLKNKCLEMIYPIFNINPDDTEDMDAIVDITARSFKGYQHDTGTKQVVIGINVEDFIPFLNKKNHDHFTLSQYFDTSEYKWAILSEIIEAGSSVDPTVIALLKNNKKMYQIRNKNNTLTEIPKLLYACPQGDKSDNNERLIHFGKSMNDEHGRIYLFSDKKQNHETRFVVFPTIHYTENGVRYYGVLSQDKYQEF
jgi:hypothetical protein